jgi:hypothetical protein
MFFDPSARGISYYQSAGPTAQACSARGFDRRCTREGRDLGRVEQLKGLGLGVGAGASQL